MPEPHRSYETTYIVNSSIEDSQIEATISRVAEVIERNGGTITATNRWGRKRMAYAIDKKNNGYYLNLEFEGPGQMIAQLERVYQLDENIIRFLTLVLDKNALEARAKTAAETTAAAAPAPAPVPGVEAPGTPKSETAVKTESAAKPETTEKPDAAGKPDPEPRAPLFTEDSK